MAHGGEDDYYTTGLNLLEKGDWEAALETWWQGKQNLELKGKIDPRLGFVFIELATEKKAQNYYESASEIYMWAFSNTTPAEFFDHIIAEDERLIPLLPEQKKKQWQRFIKNRNNELSNHIKSFWLELDIRPATEVNERLIEHWQRITYAREHFKKNKGSIYNTDDRGLIYVKYGEPDRKQNGYFGSSIHSISLSKEYGVRGVILDDPAPEYDVWAYDTIGSEEASIFLFSYRYAMGHYGLQPGVEFVVPQFFGTKKFNYRAMYMLKYYAEMMLFDNFFYDRLSRIRGIFEASEMDRSADKTPYTVMVSQFYM